MNINESRKSDVSHMGDNSLWIELKKDNPEALHHLFQKYYNDLYYYGIRLVSDNNLVIDTIQDVFVILWESKEKLSDVEHVKAYIFKIFRNRLLKISQQNLRLFSLKDIGELSEKEITIPREDEITQQETTFQISKVILSVIEKLTDKQKEILYLKFFCNLSNSEISKTLSIKKQSVSNLLSRSISSIRKKIQY